MSWKKAAVIGLSTLALALGTTGSVQAGLINGSFETFSGGHAGAPSQLNNTGLGGYSQLSGWGVGSGTLAFLVGPGKGDTTGSFSPQFGKSMILYGPGNGTANGLPATSPDGGNYVAFAGSPLFHGTGLSQTVTGLTAGTKYSVSFSFAGGEQLGFANGSTMTDKLAVSLGGETHDTATLTVPSKGFSGWVTQTITFTATGTSELLNFLAISTPSGVPPFVLLDGVKLSPFTATPEPSSLALSGICLACFGVAGLRRRAKMKAAAV